MRFRSLAATGFLLSVASVGAVFGCSAPDPGSLTFKESPGWWGNEEDPPKPATTATTKPTTTTTGTTPTSTTTATTPPTDAGADVVVPKLSIVFKGEAYTAPGTVPRDTKTIGGHNGESKAGTDCMSCHNAGGAPQFLFAGTVYDPVSGAVKPNVEVRFNDAAGAMVARAYSNVDGNFWVALGGRTFMGNGKTAVRESTATYSDMVGSPTSGACNQGACHGAANNRINFKAN
ncbi:MAG: hypothetical protein KBF88_05080 [Polyangiaceae bacterium]|nr:hypothetical protein [Polyangiaceae bacterium]